MKSQLPITARKCCSMEKKRLVSAVRACDYCSDSYQEHRECYRHASKESKVRSNACLIV
ncbi:MAG: hypothetical protein AB7S77_22455 [Desulfatirhabdiaceae bacterium]